jgi:hypothetical protein
MTEFASTLPIPQERVLLQELNHRISNEFFSAMSLVSLAAARSCSDEVKVALRTSVTTSESDCVRAPCGDVTQGGGIPAMPLRQYASRHDRHASDSAKMGVRRLEAQ